MSAVLAAVRAELTKILTLRSVHIVTLVVLGLQILVSVQVMSLNADAVAKITPDGLIEIFAGERSPADRAMVDQLIASSLQIAVFLPGVAAVLAGQEFRGRQLGSSVLAVPRRWRLMAAKSLAAGLYLLLTALLVAALSTLFTYLAIKDWNPGLLLTRDAVFGQLKFLLFAVLFGLVTFAVTLLARSTVAGIAAGVALVAITMTQVMTGVDPALDAIFPVSAGRNLLLNGGMNKLTASPANALVVLVCWAVVALSAAGFTLDRRDTR